MHLMPRAALFTSLLPLLLLAPGASSAQDEPAGEFEGAEDVVEVRVPVNVVDDDGNPVRGLTASDFTVRDEGEEREITDFEVVDLKTIRPGSSPSRAENAIPPAARRHFLLLFDLSFSTPGSIIRAQEAAREFVLNELHPTDLAAVMAFSHQQGAQLLVTFTPDRAQLARAIDTLGLPSLLAGRHSPDPLRFLIEAPDVGAGGGAAGREAGIEEVIRDRLTVLERTMGRMEKAYERGKVSAWASGLEGIAKILASVEGRKQVVYFSEGFDGSLVLGRAADPLNEQAKMDQFYLERGQYWMVDTDDIYGNSALQGEVREMMQAFRRSDAVVQAVDISGLRADYMPADEGRQRGQEVLFYLADGTGGSLLENSNDFEHQLGRILKSSSVTYLLTFRADDLERDGSYRKLEVKADLPRGTQISHRAGYHTPRPFEELHPLEKSLLAADSIAAAAPRGDIEVSVLAPPFRTGKELAYVPVIIEMDGGDLLVGHEEEQLPVEIYTYVTDDEGRMRDFFTQVVGLDVSGGRDSLEKGGIKYYGHLEIGAGAHLVRVLVRNAETGRTGVASMEVDVPGFDSEEPVVLPPFFFEEDPRWILVRENRGSQGDSVVYPFTVNGEIYVPSARPSLPPGDEGRLCLVAYNLGEEDPEVETTIRSASGEPVEGGSFEVVERTATGISGMDKFLARFQPRGLDPGGYVLEVAVTDPATGIQRRSSVPIDVLN
ncbi:MAG: VWA domain-containing protein [Thermoanaerobaculia bacterium]|nr:VWA domain-containing protein [Thermoanaerobaculia bacterium]